MQEALDDPQSREFMENEYLDHLIENMREINNGVHRSSLVLLTLILLFALMTTGSIAAIDLGITEITDLSPVHKLLPAIIGVYFIHLIVSLGNIIATDTAFESMINLRYPVVFNRHLHYLIMPPSINNFSGLIEDILSEEHEFRIAKGVSMAAGLFYYISIFVLPMVFGLFAIAILYRMYGTRDVLVWVSATVTALSILVSLMLLTILMLNRRMTV